MKKKIMFALSTFVLLLAIGICGIFIAPISTAHASSPEMDAILETECPSIFRDKNEPSSREVYLGGVPVGIDIYANGLIFLERVEILTKNGYVFPQMEGELRKGDLLTFANGIGLKQLEDLDKVLANSGIVEFEVKRKSESFKIKIKPEIDAKTSTRKCGFVLKENLKGIGTLTFVDENRRFGCLGHQIVDTESGLSDEFSNGNIFEATIFGVNKGMDGFPGALKGDYSELSESIGKVEKNSPYGVFGTYQGVLNFQKIATASKYDVKMGKAQILTTIDGTTPILYDIEIVKSSPKDKKSEKGLVLLVTDKRLLETTGGIVQGMSGSPILQNGKLVGAVTHVFVNDSKRGYGIFISTMLDE